jgi:shikimate kinase
MKKVVLIGYMGSGKSAISKKISNLINIPFVELDDYIEEKEGMRVENIFKKKGELYFRKIEHQLFLELIRSKEDLIISTGGGTPCYFNNHELLNGKEVISVYLKASISTLVDRLKLEKQWRPLIAHLDNTELQEFIAKHLFDRSFYYNQAAYKVIVDGKNIEELATEIAELLA